MNSYRDLEIFVEAKRLAIEVHRLSLLLPKFELYESGSQVRRSSKSVAVMIVEGFGRRRYKNDYIKYLVYSHAECDETQFHLDMLVRTGSLQLSDQFTSILASYQKLSKQINTYIWWVEQHWKPGSRP